MYIVRKGHIFNHSIKKSEKFLRAFRSEMKRANDQNRLMEVSRISNCKVGKMLYKLLRHINNEVKNDKIKLKEVYSEKKKTLKRYKFKHNKVLYRHHRRMNLVVCYEKKDEKN